MRRKQPPLSIRSLTLAADCRWSRQRKSGIRRGDPRAAAACTARYHERQQQQPTERIRAKRRADRLRREEITRNAEIRRRKGESQQHVRPEVA